MRLVNLDRGSELYSSLAKRTLQLGKSFAVSALIFATGVGAVAQNASSLPTSQLQITTRDLVANGEFIKAREYLVELERRLIELPPAQQGEALESVYVFLSVSYLQTYGSTQKSRYLKDAIAACDKYISKYPDGSQLGIVLVNKADALRALGKFAQAAPVLERALQRPAVDGLNSTVQLDVLDKIVQAYYVTENWKKGIPWFKRMMNYPDFPEKVSQAATALVEAYIATDRVQEMMSFVPVLARDSGARYNIRLNAKLIEGADKLAAKEEFAQASFLYNLVLSKNELIEFHQNVYDRNTARIKWITENDLSTDNLSKLRIDAENAKNQVKALKDLKDYTAELEWRKAQMYQKTGRDYEAFWAFYRLLRDFPDRKDQLENFHYAAFVQANQIKFKDRVIELGEEYILQDTYDNYLKEVTFMLAEVYKTEGPFERFRTLATQFVVKYPNDDFAGAMIYLLADAYSSRGEYQQLADDFGEMIASMTSGRVMDGLYYWRGMAGIFIEDYDLSVRSFSQLFDQYSSSPYREDAEFRMGVVQFAMGDMDAALKTMNNFVKRYPQSVLLGEAHVYLGDLYASTAEVDLALDNYEKVANYTDSYEFIDHAFFQSARLCEENEFYGQMLNILKDYVNRFPDSPNLSRAVYELGRAFELEERPVDTLFVYLDAIKKFGDARLSFGVDEIVGAFPAKYYEHFNRLNSSINFLKQLVEDPAFREEILNNRRALFQFLSENIDIDRDVRDLVMRNKEFRDSLAAGVGPAMETIQELEKEFERFPKEKPETFFKSILEDARIERRKSLELRMMMALNDGGHLDVKASQFSEETLEHASPAVMVWIARLIRESGDLSLELLAKRALETVIANYRDDEASHFEALIEFGKLELSYANFEAAKAYLQEAVDRYPFDSDITDATVLLGDALRASGDHEAAIEKYEGVLRDKKLYGRPVRAEVQYKIGLSFFERGKFQEAHAYFERVFLAFSGFKEWAARAYLKDAESLISLGSPQDAARTLREAMKTQDLGETEVYGKIEELYQSLILN